LVFVADFFFRSDQFPPVVCFFLKICAMSTPVNMSLNYVRLWYSGRFVKQEQWEVGNAGEPSGNCCLGPCTGGACGGPGVLPHEKNLSLHM